MHIFSGVGRTGRFDAMSKQFVYSQQAAAFVNQAQERTGASEIWRVYEFYLVTGIRNLHLDPAVSSFSHHLRSWTAWMPLQ